MGSVPYCLQKEVEMLEVNANEALYKITTYELHRTFGTLIIKVKETLTERPRKFIAVPCLNHSEAPEQFFGYGSSEEQALNDCFQKIKDKTIPTDLFPHTV